jgi:hypothetical protein
METTAARERSNPSDQNPHGNTPARTRGASQLIAQQHWENPKEQKPFRVPSTVHDRRSLP